MPQQPLSILTPPPRPTIMQHIMICATEPAWKAHFKNALYTPFDFETFPSLRSHAANDYRSPFQIDRDRVCFSAPFRRLQSKTQVFQSGEYDFYRTRLTHSMEVAHIGRSITNHLNITSEYLKPDFRIDVDLIEAICLAHDLGHPPFGHIGERKLNELMAPWGGFEGNAQTLRILTEVVYYQGKGKLSGMKPTRAFLDGILKYKSLFKELASPTSFPENHFLYNNQQDALIFAVGNSLPPERPQSIECQIMDWADDAAYSLHDIIDGVRASFITSNKIEQWLQTQGASFAAEWPALDLQKALTELKQAIEDDNIEWCFSKKIGAFIYAAKLERATPPTHFASQTHRYDFKVHVDPAMLAECALYKRLALDLIFQSPPLQRYEFKGGMILESLFNAIHEHYITKQIGLKILPESVSHWLRQGDTSEASKMRKICDYLSDLTDRQAIQTYKRLYHPDFGSITDLV